MSKRKTKSKVRKKAQPKPRFSKDDKKWKKSAKKKPAKAAKPSAKAKRRKVAKASKAAKKGWATRRRNERAAGVVKRTKKQEAAVKRAQRGFNVLVEKEVQKRLAEEIAKLKRTDEQVLSAARAQVIEDYMKQHGFVETDETVIIARMNLAESQGRSNEEAHILADEFNYDVREVYTLWMSPTYGVAV